MRNSKTHVVVSELDIAFGDRAIATRICFEASAEGKALAVIGPNGIGKTSLLRLIGGELAPPRKTIWVNGSDVSYCSAHGLARLGLVWGRQLPRVVPELNVVENILLGAVTSLSQMLQPWRKSKMVNRARRLAEMIGLPSGVQVNGFSAGQRRAVELCRCFLMPTSKVYLLDEPAVNLDMQAVAVLRHWVESVLAGRDVIDPNTQVLPSAVILIEHQLERLGVPHETLNLTQFVPKEDCK